MGHPKEISSRILEMVSAQPYPLFIGLLVELAFDYLLAPSSSITSLLLPSLARALGEVNYFVSIFFNEKSQLQDTFFIVTLDPKFSAIESSNLKKTPKYFQLN